MKSKIIILIFMALQNIFLYSQVSPLFSTTWNQTCYYNTECPTTGSGGSCGHTYTGCNATGWAQILKYYSYPISGFESHCNTVPTYSTHCVDFSLQTYNYAVMPNNVTSSNPEVAKLMYHLGVALNMNWSGTNSTSFFDSKPLKKYFKYTPRMYNMNYLIQSYPEILDSIKSELNAGRPIFVKSNTLNHFYIIDGYNAADEVHCNFGWGGVYDGYYPLTNVNILAGNATPHIFIMNIRPIIGDMETASDTIFISSNTSGSNPIEFTSLSNWSMITPTPWISLDTTSGNAGYINQTNGSTFSASLNNGQIRYGYIYIQNATDIDTIVVKQEASPLQISPDTLYFTASGGSQNVNVDYLSWGTWNSSSPDSWISYTPTTASGNAVINVTTSSNTGSNKIGFIYFSGGVYTDTLIVYQDGLTTSLDNLNKGGENNTIKVFPIPSKGLIYISFEEFDDTNIQIKVYDYQNKPILEKHFSYKKELVLDLSNEARGVYFINVIKDKKIHIKKVVLN